MSDARTNRRRKAKVARKLDEWRMAAVRRDVDRISDDLRSKLAMLRERSGWGEA